MWSRAPSARLRVTSMCTSSRCGTSAAAGRGSASLPVSLGPLSKIGQLVEVHCTLPRDVARARYQARASRRHAGHLDTERTDQELWGEPPPSPGLGPVIEVDTSADVDLDQLLARLGYARR